MDHVQTILKNNIYEYILKPYINSVSVKYKINENDLLDLLENINNLDQTEENVKVEKESVPTCPYMYTKGKLANTVCGVALVFLHIGVIVKPFWSNSNKTTPEFGLFVARAPHSAIFAPCHALPE